MNIRINKRNIVTINRNGMTDPRLWNTGWTVSLLFKIRGFYFIRNQAENACCLRSYTR